jgi:hypothetical protein
MVWRPIGTLLCSFWRNATRLNELVEGGEHSAIRDETGHPIDGVIVSPSWYCVHYSSHCEQIES